MFGVRRATKEFFATVREISDECLRLKAENEVLRTENAKLRELLSDTLMDTREYCAKYGIDYDGLGGTSRTMT